MIFPWIESLVFEGCDVYAASLCLYVAFASLLCHEERWLVLLYTVNDGNKVAMKTDPLSEFMYIPRAYTRKWEHAVWTGIRASFLNRFHGRRLYVDAFSSLGRFLGHGPCKLPLFF